MRLLKLKIRKAQEARLKKPALGLKQPVLFDIKQPVQDLKQPLLINIKYEEPSSYPQQELKPVPLVLPSTSSETEMVQPKRRRRSTPKASKTEGAQCTKNIVINYGKAIASFASSDLAIPYLESIAPTENVTVADFTAFIRQAKETIGGIDSFRHLLLVSEKDDEKTKGLKMILKQIGEIFVKYFSVNWIFHGRVTHKMIYLKYRNKMLRRIQRPEFFTYIKEHKKKSK